MLQDGQGKVLGQPVRMKERVDIHVGEARACEMLRQKGTRVMRPGTRERAQSVKHKLVKRVAEAVVGQQGFRTLPERLCRMLLTENLKGAEFAFDNGAASCSVQRHRRLLAGSSIIARAQ